MIRLHLTPQDFSQIRFVFSPMAEVTYSYFVLLAPARHAVYLPWIKSALSRLEGKVFPHLHGLLESQVNTTGGAWIPDMLMPSPTTPVPHLEDELDSILKISPDAVREDVGYLKTESDIIQQFRENPEKSLQTLCDELHCYWKLALEPYWPTMSAVLEGDILYRARRLAKEGPDAVFNDLHPMIRYEDQTIIADVRSHTGPDDLTLNGHGLRLMPMVFGWPDFVIRSEENDAMIAYGARGIGLFDMTPPDPGAALTAMMGEGRARILTALRHPSNNGQLALKFDLTPGAVTHHINRLREAGLVESNQVGKHVFYQLTLRGEALLDLFESADV